MKLVELRRDRGTIIYGHHVYRIAANYISYGGVAVAIAFVLLSGTVTQTFWQATLLLGLLAAVALCVWQPLSWEVYLDLSRKLLIFREKRLWGRWSDRIVERRRVRHVVLAKKHYGEPYKILYLVTRNGRGIPIDRGDEINLLDQMAVDVRDAVQRPLYDFDTDLAGARMIREPDVPPVVSFWDMRNFERQRLVRIWLVSGAILVAVAAWNLGAMLRRLTLPDPGAPPLSAYLFLTFVSLVLLFFGARRLLKGWKQFQILRLLGFEVREGVGMVLHFRRTRKPATEEFWPVAEISKIVQTLDQEGDSLSVALQRYDGRTVVLDHAFPIPHDRHLRPSERIAPLFSLTQNLRAWLNVPVEQVVSQRG